MILTQPQSKKQEARKQEWISSLWLGESWSGCGSSGLPHSLTSLVFYWGPGEEIAAQALVLTFPWGKAGTGESPTASASPNQETARLVLLLRRLLGVDPTDDVRWLSGVSLASVPEHGNRPGWQAPTPLSVAVSL